jgi:PhnB protein
VVGESPLSNQVLPQMKDYILHAYLKTAELDLMGTDMQPEKLNEGNAVHLCLICKTEEKTHSLFGKLSTGGNVKQPLSEMFFGLIGTFVDRFGKSLILECNQD